MEYLTSGAIIIISYLGLHIGYFISYFSQEELKTGEKIFPYLQLVLFYASVAYLLISSNVSTLIKLSLLLLIVLSHFILSIKFRQFSSMLHYGFFSIGYMFYDSQLSLAIFSSIIFLYGIVTGSLFICNKKNRKLKVKTLAKLSTRYIFYLILSMIIVIIREIQYLR